MGLVKEAPGSESRKMRDFTTSLQPLQLNLPDEPAIQYYDEVLEAAGAVMLPSLHPQRIRADDD
jgi:hypothetical protein